MTWGLPHSLILQRSNLIYNINIFKGDVADINVEDTFSNIGLDSLDIMELVMQIEDEFDCKIELNQELNTITKLAEYIEAQK